MENQILDYAHSLDWSESQVDAMKAWLSTTWMALEGDEPDQDFLEYIMVMIKTQKKMHELQAELKDLGVDEEKARKFAIGIGEKLQEVSNSSPREKKAESKVISVVSTATQEKKTLGPLKSSRGPSGGNTSNNVSSTANPVVANNAGSSRLLQSALSSSRTVNTGNNNSSNGQQRQQQGGNNNDNNTRRGQGDNQGNNHGQKRGQDNFNDRQDRDGFKRQNFNNGNNHNNPNGSNSQRTVSMAAPQNNNLVTKNAPPAVGSVEYFQEMNKVAQASGFKNAQEMLASQKEMMSLMQGVPAAPAVVMAGPPVAAFAPPVPMYPYPQQGFQQGFPVQPPYPGGAPPPPQGQPFYGGRGYAGRGGGRWEAGYTGRGGRGRGRGAGRGAPGADAGAAVESSTDAASAPADSSAACEAPVAKVVAGPAIYAEMEQAAAAESAASAYAGRGGGRGRGRGYQGRGDWNAAAKPFQQQAYPAYPAAPFAAQPYAGRGYQGRGYQGRGGRGFAPQPAAAAAAVGAEGATEGAGAPQHKVWVRKPDLGSALVTGR
eukprot:CAMPEP_0184974650 /NCGR_PEP_ID=MMETSP1098-20130426/6084_1 /TAXON_ID=89044 /ORGANISM="Spumella elongata, Strain CCAP 955/1" /LENGTH=543 /DNA_ID=CAMNT_0027497263 /DNA_START=21 /DNA_END=1652 /DNA_ORIENTATION=+